VAHNLYPSFVVQEWIISCKDDRMRDETQIRIEKLKREIEEVCDEKPVFGTAPDCPPAVEEMFLRRVLACEVAEKKRRQRRA
jgi:hypothetical protein